MNKKDSVIRVDHASVRFNIASEKVDNLKEYFVKLVKKQLYFEEFFALKNVSIDIKRGESWGLIGRNGAGKSTLLKLICGILSPYEGSVSVSGKIAPLIELGAGLDSRLTAGENILLNGALLGHTTKYMQEHFDEIVEFAELRKFLDMPIKNYSSGMRARLGFSIATTVNPDILIVDEVLSVGDAAFRKKCQNRMEKMLSQGTTLLFVSHNEKEVARLCEKSIWLEQGEIAATGKSSFVCRSYTDMLTKKVQTTPLPAEKTIALNITVTGAGYVGLVTAAVLSKQKHKVTCFDTDVMKVKMLQNGICPLYEPQLAELLNTQKDNIQFTDNAATAYANTDVIFLAVGTPETDTGEADLQYIFHAINSIVKHTSGTCRIVLKSTVPVGTANKIKSYIKEQDYNQQDFHIISNPEFLSQGSAVQDMLHADRIIIGTDNPKDAAFMKELYKPFHLPIITVGHESAEMVKYASNNFLALKISYINEIANLCEKTDANITDVVLGMGLDSRIGNQFMNAGIGYGGSCLPKDTKALHRLAAKHNCKLLTIQSAIDVNDMQKIRLLEKARNYYSDFSGLTITFLGVTFKPDTDDLREAPSLINAELLLQEGAKLRIWDPQGANKFIKYFPDHVSCFDSIDEALSGSDLCMIFTEWTAIKNTDPLIFKRLMKHPIVLDGRNCFNGDLFSKHNISYEGIGLTRK